jgi:hypothetical protein
MVELTTRPTTDTSAAEGPIRREANPVAAISRRIDRLPVEVGVLLMAAGVTTGMLPPPPGPFDLTIVASGGLVLWPRGFRVIDSWTQRRFPTAHRAAMSFLSRFLDDLERRFPEPAEGRSTFDEMFKSDR